MRPFIVLLALLFPPLTAFAEERAREIMVTGDGMVTASPDMAEIRIEVSRRARGAADAMSAVAEAVAAVLSDVQSGGIETRDVQTTQISLAALYDYPRDAPQRFLGYQASSNLMVRIRDLGQVGSLLDTLVSDGVNGISGPDFTVAEPEPFRDEARRAAMADGHARATLLAEAAGVALGPVMQISDGPGAIPGPVFNQPMTMEAAGRAMPVATGEIEFRESVTLIYAISDG